MSLVTPAVYSPEAFDAFVLEHNIIGLWEEPRKLVSGRFSHWYVNWRSATQDAHVLNQLSDFLLSFIHSKGIAYDTIYGVPEGVTKLTLISQYKVAVSSTQFGPGSHIISMGRGKAKEHGDPKDRYYIGAPKGKTILVEDTVTTGDSMLRELDRLVQEGKVDVCGVVAIIDRLEKGADGLSVRELVEKRGIPYYTMSNAQRLLPQVCRRNQPSAALKALIQQEIDTYCHTKIQLP